MPAVPHAVRPTPAPRATLPGRPPLRRVGILLAAVVAGLVVAAARPAAAADPAKAGAAKTGAATADPVKLDKPVRVATVKADKARLTGRVAAYGDAGFDLLDDKDAATTVAWSELLPKSVMEVYGAVLAKGTAGDWVAAGRVMYHLDGGKDYGERAFARAMRLDPLKAAAIEAAKASPPARPAPPETASARTPGGRGDGEMLGTAGTRRRTQAEELRRLWSPMTDAEQAESVATLKAFAGTTVKGQEGTLKLFETKYFLFYSDLKADEARKWAGLLDKMNDRLNEMFAIAKGANAWRGKCLTFVYADAKDYHAHMRKMYEVDSQKTAGMCTSFGNGFVHVAFYRQPQELEFAHVLVHESVHGFIHRYRSHERVPSWANEGLAEVIAYELVPQKPAQAYSRQRAVEGLRANDGVGSTFFSGDQIEGWQYPVAETLCAFMIGQKKQGYVAFINGLKDGQAVDESLEKNFGADKERLAAAYVDSMGVRKKNNRGK